MREIGCFVSSHGYGHATRMSAVLDRLSEQLAIVPHIFTSAPQSIFAQSLQDNYKYHYHLTDIGLIQKDAFHVDIEATCTQLGNLVPFSEAIIDKLAEKCRDFSLIICDISPLGIAVARKIGIPSVLIENFTWDWLYNSYRHNYPQIGFFADYFEELFAAADYHIQTEPLCRRSPSDLYCGPIFRRIRGNSKKIRESFNCDRRKVILITLGGIGFESSFKTSLNRLQKYFFIFSGPEKTYRMANNILFIDRISNYYHPDLINSVDLVVFKSGYSTLAECYQAGNSGFCIQRDDFAESKFLQSFARQHLQAEIISQTDFCSGKWLDLLSQVDFSKSPNITLDDGAASVAKFLLPILGNGP